MESPDEASMRGFRRTWIEWRYLEECSKHSPAFLETCCDWYCGDDLKWLFGFDPPRWRKYAREPLAVPLPGRRTALEALWPMIAQWYRELESR